MSNNINHIPSLPYIKTFLKHKLRFMKHLNIGYRMQGLNNLMPGVHNAGKGTATGRDTVQCR